MMPLSFSEICCALEEITNLFYAAVQKLSKGRCRMTENMFQLDGPLEGVLGQVSVQLREILVPLQRGLGGQPDTRAISACCGWRKTCPHWRREDRVCLTATWWDSAGP